MGQWLDFYLEVKVRLCGEVRVRKHAYRRPKGLTETGVGGGGFRQQVSVCHQRDSSVLGSDRASLVSSELHSRHVFM